MYFFLCFFYVYAFLGWCAEVAYAALLHGRFINRGFLNGPVCPIYGFGVLLALYLLRPLQPYWPLLFAGSVLLTSLLELATGFALEKIFGKRWWDYSKEPFNFRGYICLRFSLLWGFACVFVVDILHPTVSLFVALLPFALGVLLLLVCTASMAVDLTATVRTIANLRQRQSQVDALAARMRELSNEFGESLSVRVLDAVEVGTELKEDLSERAESVRQEAQERAETIREQAEQRAEEIREQAETVRQEAEQRVELARKEAEQRAEAFRQQAETARQEAEQRVELARKEAEQRAESVHEQAEEIRKEAEQRAERLRKARWEAAELRTRLAQLRARPVAGQSRLTDAFPNIREQLKD